VPTGIFGVNHGSTSAFSTSELAKKGMINTTVPRKNKKTAATYFALIKNRFAFLKTIHDVLIDINQINKLAAKGAATCMHGYVARLGFGITRIKNQTDAKTEIKINAGLAGILIFLEKR
jgi:hypothetical protein